MTACFRQPAEATSGHLRTADPLLPSIFRKLSTKSIELRSNFGRLLLPPPKKKPCQLEAGRANFNYGPIPSKLKLQSHLEAAVVSHGTGNPSHRWGPYGRIGKSEGWRVERVEHLETELNIESFAD